MAVAVSMRQALTALRMWPMRRWVAAAVSGGLVAVLVGVPTGVISTTWYTRMTPVLWWNYPIWALTVVLSGLALATYVRSGDGGSPVAGVAGGGLLSALAVGCPVCNKIVVLALGSSGALSIWAPIQPVLGVAALAAISYALVRRLRGEVSCRSVAGRPSARA